MAEIVGDKFKILSEVIKKSNDIPKKLQIQGFLETIQLDQLPYNVFVDKWPEWEIVIAKPRDDLCLKIPVYKLGIYSKTQDWKMLKEMLCKTGFLPKERTIWIYGLPMELIPAIKATTGVLNHNTKFVSVDNPRYCLKVSKTNHSLDEEFKELIEKPLMKTYYISTLDPEKHIEVIIKSWKTHNFHEFFITDDEGREVIKYILSFKHMNFGIFRKSDNDLAAWYLSDINGSGLIRITLPEYRHLNIGYWLVNKAFTNILNMKKTYFAYISSSDLSPSNDTTLVHADFPFVHCVMRPKKSVISSVL